MEIVEKYAKQQQPAVCGKFAFGRCRTMCAIINWPGDPDLWPFDLEKMRVASRVENLHSEFRDAGFWVLQLFATYATDGRTDRQTKATLTAPFPMGGGIISAWYT